MENVLIQVFYNYLLLGLSFLRGVFINHLKFQVIHIAKLLVKEAKVQR